MSKLEFKTIKEKDAPSYKYVSKKSEYDKLYKALEDLKSDEVLLISFEDEKHYYRVGSAIRSYFGTGAFAFRRISKKEWKFILKHKTEV